MIGAAASGRRGPVIVNAAKTTATAGIHAAHHAEIQCGGIHQRITVALCAFRGGDRPVELSLNGLAPQLYHLIEGIGRRQIFVIGIERSGVCLHQRVDLAAHPLIESVKSAAVDILAHELLQIGVILAVIGFIFHQRVEEVCAGERIVDGAVYNAGGIATAPHAAKSKVIVPWKESQLPAGFVEIIVVCHGAGQAVLVDREHMDSHITEQIVDVHIRFQIIAR